jgi:3-oxoadipate enol-lactonase
MVNQIPRARYKLVRGAAHIVCVEQPEMLSEIIKAFVAEAEAG